MRDFLKLLAVAAVLFIAYVVYDSSKEDNECTVLKRQFLAGVTDMQDRSDPSLLPAYDDIRDSSSILRQLNAQCPDWQDAKYW